MPCGNASRNRQGTQSAYTEQTAADVEKPGPVTVGLLEGEGEWRVWPVYRCAKVEVPLGDPVSKVRAGWQCTASS